MEFVNKLFQYRRTQKSLRKTLQTYGTRNWANYAMLLVNLTEDEVLTLILRWVPTALNQNETMQVRIKAEQKIYDVWFKKTRGMICVRDIKEKKRKLTQLYRWKPNETFNDVTLQSLQQCIALADVLKKLS